MKKTRKVSFKKMDFSNLSKNERASLLKRYLLWLYKTTKDECDKIDRKFTQLDIDRNIERILEKSVNACDPVLKQALLLQLGEWKSYIVGKEADAQRLKFDSSGQLDPHYAFLCLKKEAVERLIVTHFGQKGLCEIRDLYEESSMRKILEDTRSTR